MRQDRRQEESREGGWKKKKKKKKMQEMMMMVEKMKQDWQDAELLLHVWHEGELPPCVRGSLSRAAPRLIAWPALQQRARYVPLRGGVRALARV